MASPKLNLQGKLILDSGKLIGSFFDRTVILMCRHDDSGAFGLILNRATNHTLGEAVGDKLADPLAKMPIFIGGPVQSEMLSFLVETEAGPNPEIAPWVTMGHSLSDLKEVYLSAKHPVRIRVFAGYSGWAAGQLEQELAQNAWLTVPAQPHILFELPYEERLASAMETLGIDFTNLAEGAGHA